MIDEEQHLYDMNKYLTFNLNNMMSMFDEAAAAVENVEDRCTDGCFLNAALSVQSLPAQAVSLNEVRALPANLSEFYLKSLEGLAHKVPQHQLSLARDIVLAIIGARDRMTVENLCHICDVYDAERVALILKSWSKFITPETQLDGAGRDVTTYGVFHKSLREWMCNEARKLSKREVRCVCLLLL